MASIDEERIFKRPYTPEELDRGKQVAAILRAEGGWKFDAAGVTHACEVWAALEAQNPLLPVQRAAQAAWAAKLEAEAS